MSDDEKPDRPLMTHSRWLATHPADQEYARRIEAAQKVNGYKPYNRSKCRGMLMVAASTYPPNELAVCDTCFWETAVGRVPERVDPDERIEGKREEGMAF